jgi:hypothetical protein
VICFYDVVDERTFTATENTRGPWHPDHQHGGPPAALLGRSIEHLIGEGFAVARITVVFLRPVPISTLAVSTQLIRDGRTVKEATATLTHDGKPVAQASALAIRTTNVELPPLPPTGLSAPRPPADGTSFQMHFFTRPVGYHTSMEIRYVAGKWGEGPVQAWMRMRGQLVAGEAPSPLSRVLAAADSGNGVSVVLPIDRYTFINPDLTVTLLRPLRGEWVCLDAIALPESAGIGLADTRLWDSSGVIGRGTQTLVIAAR